MRLTLCGQPYMMNHIRLTVDNNDNRGPLSWIPLVVFIFSPPPPEQRSLEPMALTTELSVIWQNETETERITAYLSTGDRLHIERQDKVAGLWWPIDLDLLTIDQVEAVFLVTQTYLQQFVALIPMEGMA
jgi:hypothetical protein